VRDTPDPEAGRLKVARQPSQSRHAGSPPRGGPLRASGSGALAALRQRLEYAALIVLRGIVRRLPIAIAVFLGGKLGTAYARLGAPRTRDAAVNLQIAFPTSSRLARQRLLVASFANLGRCLAEVLLLQGRQRDELLAGVTVEGLESYDAARLRSATGGVIVLTAHFGSWELSAAAMAERGYPISVVHHRIANPHVEGMVRSWRARARVEEIPLGSAATGVFRALASGRIVVMLLDQNAHRDEGVFAPFFDQPASTRSAPARIAMARGFPVLPVFICRRGQTTQHVIQILPALELEPGGASDHDDEVALSRNVACMNRAIEEAVRRAPDQWLWAHRRFRTQPDGAPPVYPRRMPFRAFGRARASRRPQAGR
jgi:KDO2-lipid IV(A) lauroyltransferase